MMKRKGEKLVEAGRLAAEYLVSQGRLPAAVLSGSRTSALARLGKRRLTPPAQEEPAPPDPSPALNLKDIEVIDLDKEEEEEEEEPKASDDGYGLMISELLDKDFPPATDAEEPLPLPLPLGDDDSIYMSLGEIPLTYLRPWEQHPPSQDYDKPF